MVHGRPRTAKTAAAYWKAATSSAIRSVGRRAGAPQYNCAASITRAAEMAGPGAAGCTEKGIDALTRPTLRGAAASFASGGHAKESGVLSAPTI